MNMKVLVLDLTHGGEVLAREYLRRGNQVTAVDIYRTAVETARCLSAEGVRILPAAPDERFDLAVAPVHSPDRFIGKALADRKLTHHQAVGELASFPYPVVEVTGVRGKTGTVRVLSFLMASMGRRVLCLSSSGLSRYDGEETVLEDKVSIAPPTLLRLSSSPTDVDLGVFEVSLGGTGIGKVSVITGLQENYPIAAGTRRAFDGKSQMAESARDVLIIPKGEEETWRPLARRCRRMVTFGKGGDVEAEVSNAALGSPSLLTVRTGRGEREVPLQPSFLPDAYTLAFSCALAAAEGLGSDPLEICPSLSGFPGARGRAEVLVDERGEMVRERNPGVCTASLDFIIDRMVREHGCRDIGLVLDPVNMKVCEKLDLERMAEMCERHPQVTGRYILPSGMREGGSQLFEPVGNVDEVRTRHRTVLWATKEGYL